MHLGSLENTQEPRAALGYRLVQLLRIFRALFRALQTSRVHPFNIHVYTLSDLGDLSNLIGSLSRTIQQYSPPSEWITCELGVFPIFLENDLLKVDRILGLTFFKASKDMEGFNTAFFNLLSLSFVLDGLFTTPVYSRRRSRFVNSAFSNRKILAQNRSPDVSLNFVSGNIRTLGKTKLTGFPRDLTYIPAWMH